MTSSSSFFTASIGKKQIMALTGAGLIGFTVTHLIGNFLILAGPDAFNLYGHTLVSNPLIYVAEAILAGMFLLHIFLAVVLKIQNNLARPESYAVKVKTGRGKTTTQTFTSAERAEILRKSRELREKSNR